MTGVVDSIESPVRPVAKDDAAGEARLHAEDDGRRLTLVLRKGKIIGASHDGVTDPAERQVFDVFCKVLVGLPIQEAADHAGHHVMARLRVPDQLPPVPGIVTPWNADPRYRRPMRLIRRIRGDHAADQHSPSVENFWNPTISKDWLRRNEDEQLAQVDRMLGEFLGERGLAPGSLVAVGIEGNIRVFLAFSDAVDYQLKPALLMDFERRLRAHTANRLEVFAEEMADGNRIRRL
jgi:hypothetical protein